MAQQITWQEYATRVVRAAAILTNAYVAGTVIGASSSTSNVQTLDQVDQFNHLALQVDFTLGSLTSVGIKIEFSDDNTNFYQLQKTSNASGVITTSPAYYSLTATGAYYFDVNADFFNGGGFKTKYIRISSSGGGTVTSSSLAVKAIVGVA